jgi:hypothetical protein
MTRKKVKRRKTSERSNDHSVDIDTIFSKIATGRSNSQMPPSVHPNLAAPSSPLEGATERSSQTENPLKNSHKDAVAIKSSKKQTGALAYDEFVDVRGSKKRTVFLHAEE